MKYSTKKIWVHRIHRWICKLFKYQEQFQPYIEYKRDIQILRHQHIYNQDEWEWVVKHELVKKNAIHTMLNILASDECPAVKVLWEPDVHTAGIKVTAILEYLNPR
jgi:hypothetical protein